MKDHETQQIFYEVIEPTLQEEDQIKLRELKALLMEGLDVSLKEIETKEKAKNYLETKVTEMIKKYRLRIPQTSVDKLLYYLIRDFIDYGKIDPLMKDPLIEDISADGINIPIYIWHRLYESLPTNILFDDEEELNSFVIRLAYLAKQTISLASPILDASLPDGSRIQLTYGKEITRRGSTFTIRRFKKDPLTISDLIALNTLSSEIAAHLWYIIEKKASIVVAGGVAAGKTTMLNCLSMFIKPEMKIVSVEDTQELNLSHENWIPSVVRLDFGNNKEGAITLFDLLKAAVRQRPDYIIVGEVRGKEAYTLFQALATGHLGMSTIHAESADAVIKRLESEPMNIPLSLISMINVIMIMARTEIEGKPERRVHSLTEVVAYDSKTKNILTKKIFHWKPNEDKFGYTGNSAILERHQNKYDISEEAITREIFRRKVVLDWMVHNNIRHYADVTGVIRQYYANPDRVFKKARVGLK